MTSWGWVSITWYCSMNASWASFQLTGSRQAYHHSARMRLHLPCVEDGGEGLDALPERRRVVVEVDPCAPSPRRRLHRCEVEVPQLEVVLGEGLGLGDEGVLAVRAVAPPVEGADEPGLARPPTLGHPDATMAAGVLERPHAQVLGAHHDDRLIEDLVLDEVVGLRDLLEPAGHLPDPGPEQVDLHLVEVRVVVALLAGPVRELHREGHGQRRPSPIHDRHAGPLSSQRALGRSVYSPVDRSVQVLRRHPGSAGRARHWPPCGPWCADRRGGS